MWKDHWQLGHRVHDAPVPEKKLYQAVWTFYKEPWLYIISLTPSLAVFWNQFHSWVKIWCKHHSNPISALFTELKWSWGSTLCKPSTLMCQAFSIAARNREDIKEQGKQDYRTTNNVKTDLVYPLEQPVTFFFNQDFQLPLSLKLKKPFSFQWLLKI